MTYICQKCGGLRYHKHQSGHLTCCQTCATTFPKSLVAVECLLLSIKARQLFQVPGHVWRRNGAQMFVVRGVSNLENVARVALCTILSMPTGCRYRSTYRLCSPGAALHMRTLLVVASREPTGCLLRAALADPPENTRLVQQ